MRLNGISFRVSSIVTGSCPMEEPFAQPGTRSIGTASPSRPSSAKPVRRLRGIRLAVWGLVAVGGFFLIEHFDVALLRLRYRWLGPEPEGFLRHVSSGFREFGQTVAVIVVLVLVATYHRRWKTVVLAVLLSELIAAMVYNPCKLFVGRYRPEVIVKQWADEAGIEPVEVPAGRTSAETWLGFLPANRDAKRQSFPSGHSAGAFALAGVLAWFYPELRVLLWILAGGCAVSRFIDGVHWLSDCWAGAVIGYGAARVALTICLRGRSHTPDLPGAQPDPQAHPSSP